MTDKKKVNTGKKGQWGYWKSHRLIVDSISSYSPWVLSKGDFALEFPAGMAEYGYAK